MAALIALLLLVALLLPMLAGIRRVHDLPRDAPPLQEEDDNESP